jgi:hypothetical protein
MKSVIAFAVILLISISPVFAEEQSDKIFRQLEDRVTHAVVTKDAAEMNKLFANNYVSVGVSGQIRSKTEVIDAYTSGKLAIASAQTEKITVRQYNDIAIVVGFVSVAGKDGDRDISGRYAFTRIYKSDSGEWHAVSFQATLVK